MKIIALFPLTARQQEILDFMWDFYLQNDQLPPAQVIASRFGFFKTAASDAIRALARKSYVEKNSVQKYRFTAMFHGERRRGLVG